MRCSCHILRGVSSVTKFLHDQVFTVPIGMCVAGLWRYSGTVLCWHGGGGVHALSLRRGSRVVVLHHTVTCVTTTSMHAHVG
jgi:hypothetical protein